MFIIHLWDVELGKSIVALDDFSGNELFLLKHDNDKYPLLSELSNCDMELFSQTELIELLREIENLMEEFSSEYCVKKYLLSIIELIECARAENKSILFSPF